MNELARALETGFQALKQSQPWLAEQAFAHALQLAPTNDDALRGRAWAFEALDWLPVALNLYRKGFESRRAWAALGLARCSLRLCESVDDSLWAEPAFESPEGVVLLTQRLQHQGRPDVARQLLSKATEQWPQNGELCAALAIATPTREAVDCALRAVTLVPDNRTYFRLWVQSLLSHQQFDQAQHEALQRLAQTFDAELVWLAAAAFEALGRTADAQALTDVSAWLYTQQVADVSLATAVASAVVDHPSAMRSPLHHATQGGLHTGELFGDAAGPLHALEARVHEAVAHFHQSLRAGTHPFVRHCPAAVSFQSWGVGLKNTGRQTPHIHPDAWLSGVFYAQAPHGEGNEGCLQLLSGPSAPPRATHTIRPRAGMLVLFPSWAWHHTLPTQSQQWRVSVAFDVHDTLTESTFLRT
jgi:tetratricopeptide (TPR) repeat protein